MGSHWIPLVALVPLVPCMVPMAARDNGRREWIDLSDRPALSTLSTLSTSSNLWVNLVNPVNLVQNRAGRVNWVNQASTQ